MSYLPSDLVKCEFSTQNPTTGAALNADSLPVGTFFKNIVDDGTVTVTITNIDTGRYAASFTIPSGAVAGDTCGLSIAATVSSVAGKGIVWQSVLDKKRIANIIGTDNLPLISTDVQDLSSSLSINVKKWLGGTIPAVNQTGVPLVDLKYILGSALTETAGLIAAAFSKFFNKATPTGTVNSLPDAVPNAAGGLPISVAGGLDMDDMAADIDAAETRVTLALPAFAPQAAGGLITSTAGSLDIDDLAADVDATETRVTTALPNAAPNAAGGLLITAAGSLDMDDLAADVDATETRVTTALPNAAPQAAGGLITSTAGSQNIDEALTDIEEIQTTIGVAGAGLTAIPDSVTLTEIGADVDELIVSIAAIPTSTLDAAGVRSAVGLASANLDTQLSGLATATAIATLQTELTEMHGLLGQFSGLRDAVYSGTNLATYNLFLYDTSGHAATNDGVTGVLHEYSVTNTYSGSNLATSVMTRVS